MSTSLQQLPQLYALKTEAPSQKNKRAEAYTKVPDNEPDYPHSSVFVPFMLPKEVKAHKIACTWTASILVCYEPLSATVAKFNSDESVQGGKRERTTREVVYTCGTGQKGELGREVESNTSFVPKTILDFPPPGTSVVNISASMSHVVAVLSDGSAWAWGAGRKGQLGSPPETVVPTPRMVQEVEFAVHKAVCGKDFTVLLGSPSSGHVKVLGGDKVGLKRQVPSCLSDWQDVSAGWSSLYVLSADGKIASWGSDTHGQLVPPNLPPVVEMAVGSEHVVVLTDQGEVLSWGWGEHGNCGPIDNKAGVVRGTWNILAISKYLKKESRITGLGAGCATSWIIIETDGLVL